MEAKNKSYHLDKPWLNAEEAAVYLGVKPGSLRNLCSQGRVPYHKMKGCKRGRNVFNRKELDEIFSEKLGGYRCGN